VLRGQLDREHHRRRERRDLERRLAPRDEGHREREQRGEHEHAHVQPLELRLLAPDRKRRLPPGLVAQRAVIKLAQAAVGNPGHERRDDHAAGHRRRQQRAPPPAHAV